MFRKKNLVALVALGALSLPPSAFAVSLTVNNPSFDSFSTAGWTGFNNFGAYNGAYGANANDNLPVDGSTGYMRYDNSYMEQLLSETIDASKAYTLQVDVARANDAWGGGSGGELYAWNGVTASRIGYVRYHAANQWGTLSLQVSGAELAPYAGQTLGVRLRGGNADRAHFDNVRVDRIDVPSSFQAPSNMTVPDYSFETSGAVNGSWAGGSGIWNGGGWPMGSGSYGQNATDGSRIGVQSTYQLLPDTFIEGARYTLTVDASLRGDRGDANPLVDSSALMFFRGDQYPGSGTAHFSPSLGTLHGEMGAAVNPPGINGAGDWVTLSVSYIATAADAGQQIGIFLGAEDPRIGAQQTAWDNVRLTVELAEAEANAVPEPSTYALGLIGLVGVALIVRRNKRKSAG